MKLIEDRRQDLIKKSRRADYYKSNNQKKGRNRFERRLHSRVSSSAREFNKINMEKLFTKDILDINVLVHGETDDYTVKISFSGFIELMREQFEKNHPDDIEKISVRDVMRALTKAFETKDVYIHCNCFDFQYRFSWWALANGTSSFSEYQTPDNKDVEPSVISNNPPEITNPTDSKGAGCKHCMLVLSNNSFLIKVASVIRNYIIYIHKHYENLYAEKIYPALFGEEYVEPYQMDIRTELDTDGEEVDTANKWAATKNQWKAGNPYRFKKNPYNNLKGQQTLEIDTDENSEEEET